MNIKRARVISENITFFNTALENLAARHFFTEAVRCVEYDPPLSLAGITCLICGIEGSLRFSVEEHCTQKKSSETIDLDSSLNFNNRLLQKAAQLGFNIEVLAFHEEVGKMAKLVEVKKPPVGIVMWRNELTHGRAYRAAANFGQSDWSDPIMLEPAFKEMLDISYRYSQELAKFRGVELSPDNDLNPFGI
ncbi:hypothetical protein [Pararhodobacter sp.]|uniref:hypothetical protein n=1 Tax=Pararhodobacter sp. TaxID=2127056 RepID=UPI002B0013D9|nr:hypothetical protein [Pararhodobacter sp.]